MIAAVLAFPNRCPGTSGELPSLADMCAILRKNYTVLDDVDRSFFALIYRVMQAGDKAKIETIIECRSIAWSMCNRYGLGPAL